MRILFFFLFLTLFSCSAKQNKTSNNIDRVKSYSGNTIKKSPKDDKSNDNDIKESQSDTRKEFIKLYSQPIFIDTFFVDNGKKYEILFHHFSTMDSLIVPATYNFDTNKDFTSHNFISELILLSNKDTLFNKQITKSIFGKFLDSSLIKYAVLLYPNFYIVNDSIEIDYSITIPVTDVGIGVVIKFDKNGNYIIER